MKMQELFTPQSKMADLILTNYTLLSLLPRFDIELGFKELTVSALCQNRGVDTQLFLMVCNLHTHQDYTPSQEEIATLNIENLMQYLSLSHKYYCEQRITSIEEKLLQITASRDTQSEILLKFFDEYKREVINHFNYEDSVVFPYVRALLAGKADAKFHIDQYEENHENIDDKLSDLKSILIKYLPKEYSSKELRGVLLNIFLFEDDLDKHTRIEDKIFIPLVKSIEKSYE